MSPTPPSPTIYMKRALTHSITTPLPTPSHLLPCSIHSRLTLPQFRFCGAAQVSKLDYIPWSWGGIGAMPSLEKRLGVCYAQHRGLFSGNQFERMDISYIFMLHIFENQAETESGRQSAGKSDAEQVIRKMCVTIWYISRSCPQNSRLQTPRHTHRLPSSAQPTLQVPNNHPPP